MNKLRVGIIGAGQIAQTAHIPNYQKRSDVEVVALVDRHKEKAQQVAKDFNIPYVFEEASGMFDTCEIDAVSVCTPNKYHAEATILALQSGCHVFCEKPPAITVDEALKMEKAHQMAGKVLTFNLHYRHSAEVETIKKFMQEGELGDIYSARVHALRRRGIPGWGVFTNKEIQGGGPLIDIGIHMLDTALYLMNYPEPEEILAVTHQRIGIHKGVGLMGEWDPETFTVEDAAMGMIRFENGKSLLLETSFALNMKEKSDMSIQLFGDKGGASVFPPELYQEKHGSIVDLNLPYLPESNKYEKSIFDFVDSCLGTKEPLIQTKEGITLQKIIHSFYESARLGKSVHFHEV